MRESHKVITIDRLTPVVLSKKIITPPNLRTPRRATYAQRDAATARSLKFSNGVRVMIGVQAPGAAAPPPIPLPVTHPNHPNCRDD